MGYFENIYSDQENMKMSAEEVPLVLKYNDDLDIIQEIIAEIMIRAKMQHPEEYRWVSIYGIRYVSWSITKNIKSPIYEKKLTGCFNLLSDGRLLYVKDWQFNKNCSFPTQDHVFDSRDDSIISFEHIDSLSDPMPVAFCTSVITELRRNITNYAQQYFGVMIKVGWMIEESEENKDNTRFKKINQWFLKTFANYST